MRKVWFVTGANSGIGAGIVKAALAVGDQVVATARNLTKLRAVFSESDQLALLELDVTNEAQARHAVTQAVERFRRIDSLVNNAGYSALGNFEELTTAAIEQQFATNFYGVVHVMRAALPVLRAQRSGHIFNISSVAGVTGYKHCAAYGASKFAMEGLSLAVAAEVEQFGINVTVVEPGFFRTELISPANAKYAEGAIADYASEGSASAMWTAYHGTQNGSPEKLGHALVQIASMEKPLKFYAAGSDAVSAIRPVLEERLAAMSEYAALSASTDGVAP